MRAIAAEHISKSYGNFRAVHDLSFEVFGGEIFAMLGPNGAGKSTTIRMILDILKPDTGSIEVLGGPLTDATKDRIGYLPEERGLYRNVPVLEMMIYLGTLKGLSTAEARKRSLDYLERLSLLDSAKKKVSELSKGMQQKVQFAVTVLHDPDLIIIDEPFSGLDPVNTLIIQDLLLDFKKRGKAVVMSTHDMPQIEELAERLLMINHGELKLYGPVGEVRAQYALPAVRVEGKGDWKSLAGIDRVETSENGTHSALLYLKPNVTTDSVLAEIAARSDMHIQSFELAVPSLNDIFVQVVTGKQDVCLMSKTWLIIKHEYLTNIKRRAFLFGAFGVPIISIVLMAVVFGLVINNESDMSRLGTVGYVDLSGVLANQIGKPDNFAVYDTETAARAALDADKIGAYFVVEADYMKTGKLRAYGKSGLPDALNDTINGYLRSNLSTGLDPAIAARIKDPMESSIQTLDNGRIISDSAVAGLFLVPIIFVMVFLFASQATSGYLMSGVVEEKTNRIMEILITSVTPFQLLFGKVIGLGLLGLTQLAIWLIAGAITLSLGHSNNILTGIIIPPDLAIVAVVYFLLGYFLLSSVMAGIGVVVGSEQESRQFSAIFSLVLVIPFFLITSFITDPNGAVVTFLTLFPLTSPISMILRIGFSTVPLWQLIASLAILLLTGLAVAWASARIFRWALLLYGKRPGIRELIRVIRRPSHMATTATGESS